MLFPSRKKYPFDEYLNFYYFCCPIVSMFLKHKSKHERVKSRDSCIKSVTSYISGLQYINASLFNIPHPSNNSMNPNRNITPSCQAIHSTSWLKSISKGKYQLLVKESISAWVNTSLYTPQISMLQPARHSVPPHSFSHTSHDHFLVFMLPFYKAVFLHTLQKE